MIGLGFLIGAALIFGVFVLLIKLLLALIVLPLKIGIGAVKIVAGLLIGIPLLILLGVIVAPVAIVTFGILGILLLPFVLLVKAVF